ncbi:tetratricopeptide repeat protein [Legionella fairfieldensis]|uniref:tetratricopeptide repeat protein n=1 Tax=Legionella fairfieldensis TaxID=45064 RepID=UPI0004901729|nr:tetratricopeptide repeat protein [Legionella fairfieldensis]
MNEWWLLACFIMLGLLALPMVLYPFRKMRGFSVIVASLAVLSLTLAYQYWGAWSDWRYYVKNQVRQQQVQAVLQTIKSPAELIKKLQMRLQSDPKSARGWYLLGRLYVSQNEWSQARDAFLNAYQLNPHDEAIIVNYAQSLWQLNQQQFNEQIRVLFKSLLQNNPQQPDALAMLAMDAFVSHNYQLAIDYWQQLLKLAPGQSQEAQMIRKAIAKAQRQLSS